MNKEFNYYGIKITEYMNRIYRARNWYAIVMPTYANSCIPSVIVNSQNINGGRTNEVNERN